MSNFEIIIIYIAICYLGAIISLGNNSYGEKPISIWGLLLLAPITYPAYLTMYLFDKL